jgi:uncharacterized protein YabE (DUF348 family)
MAPEPESWIPIESLESLPELEELLDPRFLVDSGQTRAVRLGDDGLGYVSLDQELEQLNARQARERIERERRKRNSQRRTLHLQRKTKLQRTMTGLIIIAVVVAGLGFIANRTDSPASAAEAPRMATAASFVPISVPVVIEGVASERLSVASNMDEFVKEQGLTGLEAVSTDFSRTDFIAKRSAPALEFRYVKTIRINADGKSTVVMSDGLSVEDVLVEHGIITEGQDVTLPARTEQALGVRSIDVQRVTTSTRTEERDVPFSVEKRNDSSLTKGKTKTIREGKAGRETVTYTQTLHDGNVASESITSTSLIQAPVTKIIAVGTKPKETQSGKASFYSAPGGTCAHKTLPKGTIVTVTNTNNGKSVTCKVADRGPYIAGRVVDLSKDTFAAIAPLSSGVVPVRLSW